MKRLPLQSTLINGINEEKRDLEAWRYTTSWRNTREQNKIVLLKSRSSSAESITRTRSCLRSQPPSKS